MLRPFTRLLQGGVEFSEKSHAKLRGRRTRTLLFESLESRTLLTSTPTGTVEVLNSSTISGWVFNADDAANPLQVIVTVDGSATTLTADKARPDLLARLGSANHGFSFSMPGLSTGHHTVTVDLFDPFIDFTKRLKTATLTIAPPTGSVDVLNCRKISGWAFSAADGGDPVQLLLTVNGNQFSVLADDDRADLAKKVGSADHAFCCAMPALMLGANSVAVDVVDPSTGRLKRLKSGTVNVGSPIGAVNVFNTSAISGWAFSPLEGGAPVHVVITINGQAQTIVANAGRPDLVAKCGSLAHGFSYSVPVLPPGNSRVTVDVLDPFNGQRVRIKTGVLTNRLPAGTVDVHTATRLAGWVSDPDSASPLQVQIKVNGVALGDPFTANGAHKMRGAAGIGFDVSGDFAGKIVEVFAYDQPSGQVVRVWTNDHLPKGAVTAATAYTISGWAVDPDAPNTPITVRVDIDGVTLTTATANIPLASVRNKAGALNVGYSVDIPGLTPGTHTLAVYALDGQASAAPPVLLGTRTVTNAPPVGNVDAASATTVSGWALDPDLGPDATTVNVYIDDALFAATTANVSRPDLTARYGSPNHGFSVDLSSLATGSHSITVTALDNRAGDQQEVVIYDDFINNHVPVGAVEQVTGKTITGWAYDEDAGAEPIAVDIYVDGVYSSTVTANQPDDNASAPTPNHGFTANLPSLSFGTHAIDVYASESQGNVSVLVGSQTVANNRPLGVIESATPAAITGWAADPDRLGESMQVQVYVNGVLAVSGTAGDARPDLLSLAPLNSLPSFSNYGFTLALPTLSAGNNQIDVYALDLNNSQISSLGSLTLTV